MPAWTDILPALVTQREADVKKLESLNQRLNALRPQFQEYRELDTVARALEERIRATVGTLSDVALGAKDLSDLADLGVSIPSLKEERENTPLWKVVREITRQVTQIRVVELETVLRTLEFKVSRQAIESAIETHPHTFRVTKKAREKYVSLKE